MNVLDTYVYGEVTDRNRIREVPLSHLSIEVGHLHMDDIRNDDERVRTHFRAVERWLSMSIASVVNSGSKSRVSTCFLIDDYFQRDTKPEEIVGNLLKAAAECGVSIDYIAREAGCCDADNVSLAELTAARLLPEPAPGANGSRPPTSASGWLCNGERSPESESDQAMRTQRWRAPQEFSKRHHSIFVDIELWKDADELVDGHAETQRIWSCAFLASIWQLQRLGMLRHHGNAVAQPRPWPPDMAWPEHWDELPAVIQLNPHAAPFAAYQSLSILPQCYLQTENAVRVILGHLSLDDAVTDQIVVRAAKEDMQVSRSVVDRVSHIFIKES